MINLQSIPLDVPQEKQDLFIKNKKYLSKHPFLFAVDHKVEHLNDDFYGASIAPSTNNIETVFKIAQQGGSDALITHLGLINQWGREYPKLNYVVKLNAKTNLIPQDKKDPISLALWNINQVISAQQSGINIRGVAYTIYLGSEYEHLMMQEAAQIIFEAHQQGVPAYIFAYPRGKWVTKKQNHFDLVTGAAGVAASLGADFVKLVVPYQENNIDQQAIKVAIETAGKTQILFAGGKASCPDQFIKNIKTITSINSQIGFAIGRTIFQKPLDEAITFSQKIKTALIS